MCSYKFPLLEETRAQISRSLEDINGAPFAKVKCLGKAETVEGLLYNVEVENGKELYRISPGDIVVLLDSEPEAVYDVQGMKWTGTLASVVIVNEDGNVCKIISSRDLHNGTGEWKPLYVVFLINITINIGIWNTLNSPGNLTLIQKVLNTDALGEEYCSFCSASCNKNLNGIASSPLYSKLNESQRTSVVTSINKTLCDHKSHVQLIWGPPGTGKKVTLSMILFAISSMKCRTLALAPTNAAVLVLVSHVIKLMKVSFGTQSRGCDLQFPLGDVLLFSDDCEISVGSVQEKVHLDYRVERLIKCLSPTHGWENCFSSAIEFLQDCVSHYNVFEENEIMEMKERQVCHESCGDEPETFLEFSRGKFKAIVAPLRECVRILCTDVPKKFIRENNFQDMLDLVHLLEDLETLLFKYSRPLHKLKVALVNESFEAENYTSSLLDPLNQCLSIMKLLRVSLGQLAFPSTVDRNSIIEFCFRVATLIFSIPSSCSRSYLIKVEPISLLVINEATQLKEAESLVPLQLQGLRHALLVGDECQLGATRISEISYEAGFGRSLFERLGSLGYPRHVLDVQYRMHPSINKFPNSYFYHNEILDAQNVSAKSYERNYLSGRMFGPYSFISVSEGIEENDGDEQRLRNMVEVAVVLKIMQNLYRAWKRSRTSVTVGVLSPYPAQVAVFQEKLHEKYDNHNGFVVKVNLTGEFLGNEVDIMILSTVRANDVGSLGLLSCPRSTNVALTRARHCLWILGNERTLQNSPSVWESLVLDAKKRGCFFNACEDEDLCKTVLDVKGDVGQLDNFLNGASRLFQNEKWKVILSDFFRKSFAYLKSIELKKLVLNLLLKLATGWRPARKTVDLVCENSKMIVKKIKVQDFYVLCSNDIVKESMYMQVLRVWYIVPLEEIPQLYRELDDLFQNYTEEFVSHCNVKFLEGKLEVPKTWPVSLKITRFKSWNNRMLIGDLSGASDGKCSRVSESLLLVKFYSISVGLVNHMLLDENVGQLVAPFQFTDEELEIIRCCSSSFILGRSGTGKTTVLTFRLFQKEQIHHLALEGLPETDRSKIYSVGKRTWLKKPTEGTNGAVLRQLFVTVNPLLCHVVKQQVSQLRRFCGISLEAEDEDKAEQDLPDCFLGIPQHKYPLVITLRKFLMMLDATLGDSYFRRFYNVANHSNKSQRSVSLETMIRMKEVNYERFCSLYWPHFDSRLVRNFDPSKVFIEIFSHIKGGSEAGKGPKSMLSQEAYVSMSEKKASILNSQERQGIYKIFEAYEAMKLKRGEFDISDFVINLHLRLENKRFEGEQMDFIYIDEVQDLSMKQISLFKYICQNVDEGFIFAGDTAQTISRGVDFRFQDIRKLFYNEFVGKKYGRSFIEKKKGLIGKISVLTQNFRTHNIVLRLAQSVIDLIYHFFPKSIDVAEPETSILFGEAPVILHPIDNENVLETIFSKGVNDGKKVDGFGAEQVILVRDDSTRKEISDYVRNQALVLTVTECKGLEFEDVFLYNFFSSSTQRNQWRKIYEFIAEKDLLDSGLAESFPRFNNEKHGVICHELKLLYVIITRTKQRLWFLESTGDFSNPIFDYWKKLFLVQEKNLNSSVLQSMQMMSGPAEWKSRGVKLFWEKNYEMAALCFTKSGDVTWKKRAEASELRSQADRLRYSNPKDACNMVREAGEIFDSLGHSETAVECFCDLGDYKRAGIIYQKSGELKRAGECFILVRCFELAAQVYAEGNDILECVSACKEGKLFDLGLHYIEYWKQSDEAYDMPMKGIELENIEQQFRESCALHCHREKDINTMMKYVRAFSSMDIRRTFLKSINCFSELLSLEEELGYFKEAAEIANLLGDTIHEAELLGKAGNFQEASLCYLSYVLLNSLWVGGSRGWPLMEFAQKEEILKKAQSYAKKESGEFYELVCTEAAALSHKYTDLWELCRHLSSSEYNRRYTVQLLFLRKILDVHFHWEIVKYVWEDSFAADPEEHCKRTILKNEISVSTLVYFWNQWKENMMNVLQYLEGIEDKDISSLYDECEEFCLNYFGVQKEFSSQNVTFMLLMPDAKWVKQIGRKSMTRKRNLFSLNARTFSARALSHLHSEIISVGLKVLETIESLYTWSTKGSLAISCQSRCLVEIFQLTRFLNESFKCNDAVSGELERLFRLSMKYYDNVYPLDCRKALEEQMIYLRESEFSRQLLEEILAKEISASDVLTYGQNGRVVMILLGMGKPKASICKNVGERFATDPSWKVFIDSVITGSESPQQLHIALTQTYLSDWRTNDYIPPNCFVYIVDRLLMMIIHSMDVFYTTKYSFIEWLMYLRSDTYPSPTSVSETLWDPKIALDSILKMVNELLSNPEDTSEWIAASNIDIEEYLPLLVLRLMVVIFLLCLNTGEYFDVLSDLLEQVHISSNLPGKFLEALRLGKSRDKVLKHLNTIAEAFKLIGNPFVIVSSLQEYSPEVSCCAAAIFVDLRIIRRKDELMGVLFPKEVSNTS